MVMMLYFQYPFTAQFAKRSSINELISADYGFPFRKLYMSGKYFMSQKYYFTTANLHYFISILILSFHLLFPSEVETVSSPFYRFPFEHTVISLFTLSGEIVVVNLSNTNISTVNVLKQ